MPSQHFYIENYRFPNTINENVFRNPAEPDDTLAKSVVVNIQI